MKKPSPRLLKLSVGVALALGALSAGGWMACGPVRRPDGGLGLLGERAIAPDFEAPDQEGRVHRLSEYRGRVVVLFFYPRDGTPGCTREACAFRDSWARFQRAGAQVLGVSTDDVASHLRFSREHRFPYPLLADPAGGILRSYGVSSMLGMSSRVTFVLDREGRISRVFPSVDPGVHADEVLRAVEALAPQLVALGESSEDHRATARRRTGSLGL